MLDDEPNLAAVVTIASRFQGFTSRRPEGRDALAAVTKFEPHLIVSV